MSSGLRSVARLAAGLALCLTADAALADGPFQYFSVTPCRVYDSRIDGDGATPLPNGVHNNRVQMQGSCGIPTGAKAVTINVTVVTPNRAGHITLWPTGGSEPVVSTLNFLPGESALANGAIVPLGPSGGSSDITFRYSMNPAPGTGHIIFDVTGYFQ